MIGLFTHKAPSIIDYERLPLRRQRLVHIGAITAATSFLPAAQRMFVLAERFRNVSVTLEALKAGEAAIAKGKADNANTSAFEKCVGDMKAGKI